MPANSDLTYNIQYSFKSILLNFSRLILLFLLLIVSVKNIHAQNFKQFSGKAEDFPSEISKFINTKLEDEETFTIMDFRVSWDSSKIDMNEKQKILDISKNLIIKKIRSYPDYFLFISLIQKFIDSNHPKQSFDEWLKGFYAYTDNKKISISALNNLINHTNLVLSEKLLFKNSLTTWKPSARSLLYKYDNQLRLIVDSCSLTCYAKRDSLQIYNTKGYLEPLTYQWYGNGGEASWEKAGYDRSVITSFLKKYTIDMTKTSYTADSVTFYNKVYFHTSLLGTIEDNVSHVISAEAATFPRFDSYKKEFELKNLYPHVNYKGGFSMQGAKFIGKGTSDIPAEFDFFRKDTLRLKAYSQYFIIRPDRVKGMDAAVCIYLEKDSIYHGDLQFTYTTQNNEISLIRSENYSAQSPYLNSYHKVDMNFEQLTWRIDEPMIFLTTTPGSSIGKAQFESENFFNSNEFNELQYYYDVHPLVSLKKFATKEGSAKFSALDFASYMRTNIDNLRTLLFPLALKGFIFYDATTETIEVKKRLYENISASVGRTDYDVIRFFSTTNAPLENGSLDLKTNDLKLRGIPQISVSDSQNVVIFPKNQTIILKQNRNFQFDGVVIAGLFTFYGRNFFFNYDEFKIAMKDIDSIQLKVIVGYDNFLKPIYRNVENVIQDVTGDVLVDKPDNKSGLKSYPQYPIFYSKGFSYVYYDDRKILHGVYDRRKKFHFKLDAYELDSLDNFRKEGMRFSGVLSSAGIFPDIPEILRLQPDFSLGFTHKSPANGYPVYGTKGFYKNIINLSNQGLRGNGELNYLCSNSVSKDFIFYPDSTNAIAQSFVLQEMRTGSQCPAINADTIKIHWEPYKDKLMALNLKKPFNIFNKETSHNGLLTLSPTGLFGTGVLDLTTAVVRSKKFRYKYITADADTSDFSLRSLHTDGYTVNTGNVNAHIDLSQRIGKFKSNDLNAITEFPENKYIAMLDEFLWRMDQKELEMISSRKLNASKEGEAFGFKDTPLLGSRFISTKKDQDSLSFVSPQAIYDYEENLLKAKKVAYIDVADARIFPDKNEITINPQGYVVPFKNSKILANRQTRYHEMYNASVSINSSKDYLASGKYNYVDKNKKKEPFLFNQISVDTLGETIAEGTITEPDSFTLSPAFPYQGKILLRSEEKLLRFDGATKIVHQCPNYGSSWFLFDTLVNPMVVKIPIKPKMTELNRHFIVSGTLITTDSIHVYSSFFGTRKNYSDSIVANATGILRYNEFNLSYEVASEEKLKSRDLPGNYMRLNTKSCIHFVEGTIRPGVNYGQFHHANSGIVEHDLKANQIKVNMSMALDFYMFDKAMQYMANVVDSLGKSPIDITNIKIQKNYMNLIPENILNKYNEDLAAGKPPKEMPAAFIKNIFIDDVNLIWDDVSNSYRSKGKIGIGFIAGKAIHKYYEGYMELWRKRSGDLFDLYIKVDESHYFYIAYTRGTLHVTSSEQTFNNMIRERSNNERMLKVGRLQTPYSYTMATDRKLQNVRKRWLTGEIDAEQNAEDELPMPENLEMQTDSLDLNPTVNPDVNKLPTDSVK